MKVKIISLWMMSTFAYADLVIIKSSGQAEIRYKLDDRIYTANCIPYADVGDSTSDARKICLKNTISIHEEYMATEIEKKSPTSSFYTESLILSPEVLLTTQAQIQERNRRIDIIERRRQQYGDSSVDLKELEILKKEVQSRKNIILAHETQSQNKQDYLKNRNEMLKMIENDKQLFIKTAESFEFKFLTEFKIDYKVYEKMSCGAQGTLLERTQNCSKVNEPAIPHHILVMRDVEHKVWFNVLTKNFYSNSSNEITNNSRYLYEITGQLWRRPTKEEREAGPLAAELISSKPLNPHSIPSYTSRVSLKNGKKAIEFNYHEGVMKFVLIEGETRSPLKEISIPKNPIEYGNGQKFTKPIAGSESGFFDITKAFNQSFVALNEAYISSPEMMAFFLFPFPLAIPVDAVYAGVGYPLAFTADLLRQGAFGLANAFNFSVGRNHVAKVATKKLKSLLSGKNEVASKRVMKTLIEGILSLQF